MALCSLTSRFFAVSNAHVTLLITDHWKLIIKESKASNALHLIQERAIFLPFAYDVFL
jgi:hypothetical protein